MSIFMQNRYYEDEMKPRACLIIEHIEGNLRECSFELATLAHTDFLRNSYDWLAIIAGCNVEQTATRFAEKTGIHVIVLHNGALAQFSGEGYCRAYASAITALAPAIVFASHTPLSCDAAPAIAVECNMEFISSVQNISFEHGTLIASRELFHGKIKEEIAINTPAVCTIMPGALPVFNRAESLGKVLVRTIDIGTISSVPGAVSRSPQSGIELSEAEVIVSAGRGVGKSEHMTHIRNLASLFARSAIGGSRAACDMGLVDYGFQIGMTGKSVAPKLYLACGISGSAQHIAGMKNSRTIVAINRDEGAPIFQIADVGVVDEIETFVPVFIDVCSQTGNQH